ncbi:hypothetical protein RUMCAL_02215 [Ruminococcus callidus ATCC 27760]|uniref:Uncharacterized protein n=1 Tax=Ruminococcus callidus ATCC 27760 TaxID=411473 RepID=U2KN80_9FIRM|nr:hypothetical protein RUMCAL_02215 [Ruminococcus callidus ATCC 27760]
MFIIYNCKAIVNPFPEKNQTPLHLQRNKSISIILQKKRTYPIRIRSLFVVIALFYSL